MQERRLVIRRNTTELISDCDYPLNSSFIATVHQSTTGPHTIMMTQLNSMHALFALIYFNNFFHLHLGQLNILSLQIVILK
jgi:hypothetical protein